MKKRMVGALLAAASALCLAVGLTACGDKEHKHVWDEGIVTTPATYTETGIKTYTCTECEKQKLEQIPVREHEHIYGEWITSADSHWRTCILCTELQTPAKHNWDDGVTTKPATYTETGVKTYTCKDCNIQKVGEIPKTAHEHRFQGEWYSNSESHWRECSLCNLQEERQEHSWDNGEVRVPASTSAAGLKVYTCKVCHEEKEEELPILPHTHSYSTELTGDESEHWYECGLCGDKKDSALHQWDSGIVISEATTTEKGIKQYTCTACGRKKTEEIPMLPSANQLTYKLNETGTFYFVTGFDGVASNITIPEIYNGLRVAAIAEEAFFENVHIKSLTLPKSITSIGVSAFEGCTNLETVAIPEGVTNIGRRAFANCSALTGLSFIKLIEGKVNTNMVIEEAAFTKCVSLASVEFSYNTVRIGTSAFDGCYSLTHVVFDEALLYIDASAFANCNKLNNVTLPEKLFSISWYAFDACTSLTSITLPNTVATLGAGAFRNNTALRSVTLSTGISSVADVVFQNCSSLESIVLPSNVHSVGTSAFSGCTKLKSLTVEGNLSGIGNSAFYDCFGLESIYYKSSGVFNMKNEHYNFFNAGKDSNGITLTVSATAYIPEGLFEPLHRQNAPKLKALVIENGATTINYFKDYSYLPYLTSVTVPDTLTSIEPGVFSDTNPSVVTESGVTYLKVTGEKPYFAVLRVADNVTSVTVPDGVRIIMPRVFAENSLLTKLSLPASVASLGYASFEGCSNLQEITLPFIGERVKSNWESYQYPFGYVFGSTSYTGSTPVTQYYYGSSTSYTTNATYYLPYALRKVTVLGGNVPRGAFYNCSSLTQITLPETATGVGAEAFYRCSGLTKITVPDSVTSIGSAAFSGCSGLTEIVLPFVGGNASAGSASSTTLFGYVFGTYSYTGGISVTQYYSDYNSSYCYIPSSLRKVTITGGNILYGAFYGCSMLTDVTIGGKVSSIGYRAFYNCNGLSSVTFKVKQGWWCNVSSTATSGNSISSVSLGSTYTAADYLKNTYCNYYWHCNNAESYQPISAYTIVNDSTYPFTKVGSTYTSTNKSNDSSSTLVITANKTVTVSFYYSVSSERYCDYFYVRYNGREDVAKSGTVTDNYYSVTLYAGDTLTLSYEKDSSGSAGSDNCTITNLTVLES